MIHVVTGIKKIIYAMVQKHALCVAIMEKRKNVQLVMIVGHVNSKRKARELNDEGYLD
ncbi:hypothetical protein PBV87_12720 [Niameybacter massiliensis]|uniref:Uncharacterized protein n=1 Tax=Holtiella tumoricola TaxID=3018743 RepID=A0AA42DPA6_9FIRM|nr:hypothetical protein [Holtiella tumoricola]MDA3732351.1 hypothetical protein [Holtiella tumoricola]